MEIKQMKLLIGMGLTILYSKEIEHSKLKASLHIEIKKDI